jgi:squalene-hopene/tetraprenyl-beta-curcumene cyclase
VTAEPIERKASAAEHFDARAREALQRAVDHLLAQQSPDGWWRGLMETNVTMDAEDLMMRQFLGVRTEAETQAAARWILSKQRADGSWANFRGGPADPSTTAEAYVALRLAGDPPDAGHMRRARDVVLAHGGLERTRVFTRFWLALFGQWRWEDLPALPPEMVFMPSWMPLNLYDFACWARQTVAPLTVLAALRPRRSLGVDLGELRSNQPVARGRSAFDGLDAALRAYERRPLKRLRRNAIRRMVGWIIERQEADGSWGGIQPPWVYSLMALHAAGYPTEHPVVAQGLAGWDRFTVHEQGRDGPVRWVEACQSPVWDTALALIALGDAGVDAGHPAVARASRWLLGEEIRIKGDWAVRRPCTPAGGWAFEFDNDWYPDIDDTAEVVLALRKWPSTGANGVGVRSVDAAVGRAAWWVLGMQSKDGGWAAFDADNTSRLVTRLPFCDFGAVTDPPSADVTAHVLEMLAREGLGCTPAAQRGLRWLLDAQEADGSWFGRWGANHVYGIGAAVPALVAMGVPAGAAPVRRAIDWLVAHQNADGGWGEDMRSYDEPDWVGRGESTPSQTAWALLALHAADDGESPCARRGVEWLVGHQCDDGGWDENRFTGTGFPGYFYLDYRLYRMVFPISALGRILNTPLRDHAAPYSRDHATLPACSRAELHDHGLGEWEPRS